MSNDSVLIAGTEKAKKLIEAHIINQILVPAAKNLIQHAMHGRIFFEHNMTGNTVNSYAAGVYINGSLVHIETTQGSIPRPLVRKLSAGDKFYPSWQRWDGEDQQYTFAVTVTTNKAVEPDRNTAFLQSYKPTLKGYSLVVCNGVEYATYQENVMNLDVLTSNFDFAKTFIPTIFKPMPN